MKREAFNKYNAPELVGQLFAVLEKNDLRDAVDQLKRCKVPQTVDKAWRNREKMASRVASRFLKLSVKYYPSNYGAQVDDVTEVQVLMASVMKLFKQSVESSKFPYVIYGENGWGKEPQGHLFDKILNLMKQNTKLLQTICKVDGYRWFFPNGQSLGVSYHDRSYFDDRDYSTSIGISAPKSGPDVSDPKFVAWYMKNVAKTKKVIEIPDQVFKTMDEFFNLIRVTNDPFDPDFRQTSVNARSGKQSYFFRMKLKEMLVKLQKVKGAKVTWRENPSRKDPQFISSINSNVILPIGEEFTIDASFDGVLIKRVKVSDYTSERYLRF
mgnify:FL=1|jgi:hypothetical protein